MVILVAMYWIGLITTWIALPRRVGFRKVRREQGVDWREFLLGNVPWFVLTTGKVLLWPITAIHYVTTGRASSPWLAVTELDGQPVRKIVRVPRVRKEEQATAGWKPSGDNLGVPPGHRLSDDIGRRFETILSPDEARDLFCHLLRDYPGSKSVRFFTPRWNGDTAEAPEVLLGGTLEGAQISNYVLAVWKGEGEYAGKSVGALVPTPHATNFPLVGQWVQLDNSFTNCTRSLERGVVMKRDFPVSLS